MPAPIPADDLADTTSPRHDVELYLGEMETQCQRIAGIWGGQIANARQQMDAAIVELTREFAEIVSGLASLGQQLATLENQEERLRAVNCDAAGGAKRQTLLELRASSEHLRRETDRIRASIGMALIHLQFQDRVNQVLLHVENHLPGLPEVLKRSLTRLQSEGQLTPPDFSELLQAMEASYTTKEERATHRGDDPAADGDELTFF